MTKEIDDPVLGRMRWCNRCEEYWPADLEFFFKGKGGLHSWCKACFIAWREARGKTKGGRVLAL